MCKSFPSHCAALLLVEHTVKEAVKINEREEQNENGKEKREREEEVLLDISYGS